MSCKLRKYFGARTMPNLKTIVEAARETMKNDAVILTAVEYRNRRAARFQVYFWDEHQAVMDIISRNDLLENWPDAGVYLLDTAAADPDDVLRPVRRFDALGQGSLVAGAAARQTHGKTDSLSDDGSLEKYVIPEVGHISRYDLVRHLLNLFFHRHVFLVCHAGHFRKDHVSDVLNSCFYSSHIYLLLDRIFIKSIIPFFWEFLKYFQLCFSFCAFCELMIHFRKYIIDGNIMIPEKKYE